VDDQYLDAFIRESEEEITKLNNSLVALESDPSDREAMDQIFRTAHTLKGNFGAMGFEGASNLAHAMEDLLDEMRDDNMGVTPELMDTIFTGADQIEGIIREIEADGESTTDTSETVDQLRAALEEGAWAGDEGAATADEEVLGGAATLTAAGPGDDEHAADKIKSVRVDVDQLDDLHGLVEQLVTSRIKLRRAVEQENLDSAGETLNELDKITANLQNTVMDMRLIPLMHIIRNALDHGIEPPEKRVDAGKSRAGRLALRASRERDHVVIQVEDDGAGLDVEEIRGTAIENDLRSPEKFETMDDSAVYDLVFHPGFSTAEEVTDTSGRGVGMGVVNDTVTQLDGSVSVDNTPGQGTTVSLRLPVTMAIVEVLFVRVGDEEYGIPIKNVDEITRSDGIKQINGRDVTKHNDEIYPVVDLAERFDVSGRAAETEGGESPSGTGGVLVQIRESERRIAIRCDAVNAQEEVVVKPLEGILSGTAGLSGTAVLGDGNMVHILDMVTL